MAKKICPSPAELAGYVRGTLPPQQVEAVTIHLAACPNCEDTIQNLESEPDPLISLIKPSLTAEPYIDEPECRKVVTSIERQAAADGPVKKSTAVEQAATGAGLQQVRPMNRTEFAEFLTTTGFVSPGELTALEKQLPPAEAADVQALARVLVQHGKLTKYQAAAVYQGKGKSLIFGEHVVLDKIGAGGMGQVFKARHRRMDRIVALKVMSAAAMKSTDSVKRFEREVRAAAKLAHPNIVHAYDASQQDGVHFLVMEFVDGPDLSSLLKKNGKLPVKQACDFIAQAARGFAFAHGKGVIHRDIKPGNLLVDGEGTVKILDMGLARFDDGGVGGVMTEAELTQSGAVMGTVDYMAPEQAMNTRHADSKSDVYGLGCTLYRLLTGEPVYAGQTMVEKIFAHKEKPIPALRQHRPDASPALEALITRMLTKEPARRPTMQEVADQLANIDSAPLVQTARPPMAATVPPTAVAANPTVQSRPRQVAPPKRRNRVPLLAAAGAGAILLAFGIWFIVKDKDGNEVARVNVPDGGSIHLAPGEPPGVPVAKPSATPANTATAPAVAFNLPTAALTAAPTATATMFTTPPTAAPSATGTSVSNVATSSAVSPVAAASSPSGDLYVFPDSFERRAPFAVFESLHYDGSTPLTIEGWAITSPTKEVIDNAKGSGSKRTEVRLIGIDRFSGGEAQLGWIWHVEAFPTRNDEWKLEAKRTVAGQMANGHVSTGRAILAQRDVPQHFALVLGAKEADGQQAFTAWLDGKRIVYGRNEYMYAPADPFFSQGFISELRVSKVARYTGDFTPQRRFEPDADTLALYHCDEGSGDQLIDSSGNNHHGKLTNAKWAPVGSPPGTPTTLAAASTAPSPTAVAPPRSVLLGAPIDLFSMIQLPRDVVAGNWSPVKGELIASPKHARIQVPFTPPAEYDLVLTARSLGDDVEHIVVGLVSQGRQFYFRMGTNGCSISDDDSTRAPNFVPGIKLAELAKPFQLQFSVRKDGVSMSINGRLILEYHGDLNQLRVDENFTVPRADQLFFGTLNDRRWAFSGLKLIPVLTSRAESVAASNSAPTPTPGTPALPQTTVASSTAVDLLALVQLPRDAVAGQWTREGSTLRVQRGTSTALLQIPFAPPVAEYDLLFTGRKLPNSGSNRTGFNLGAIRNGKRFYMRVRPFECGLSDGDATRSPNYVKDLDLPFDNLCTVRLAVRRELLQLDVNGQKVLDYVGGNDVFQLAPDYDALRPDQLFLAVEDVVNLEITSLQFVPLGATIATPPAPPPVAFDPAVEREVAKAVIAKGGQVTLNVNGRKDSKIKAVSELPAEPFYLVEIRFRGIETLGDADLAQLKKLGGLESIDLNGTNINDQGIAHLGSIKTLTEVQLESAKQFRGFGLAHLAQLPRLRLLTLATSGIEEAGIADTIPRLKKLEHLDVNRTKLTSAAFARGLMKLQYLNLKNTNIRDLSVLGVLPELNNLEIPGTFVNDASLATLPDFPRLEILDVSDTVITDASMPYLERFTTLKRVNLGQTFLTDAGIARLKAKLTAVNLINNGKPRSGTPPVLGALPPVAKTPIARPTTVAATPTGGGFSGGAALATTAARQPVPDANAQQATLVTVKEVFKDEYAAAKTPELKAQLAAKLVDQAKQTINDPAARYVLLNESLALAIEGVKADVLRDALLLITREYDVAEATTFVDAWNELLKRPKVDPTTIKLLFDESSGLFDEAIVNTRFDDAKRYGDFALSTSRRLPNSAAIVKATTERNAALTARQKEWEGIEAAAETLAATPDDAEANAVIGRYRALVVGDWAGAFAMLAKGSDETLKGLAAKSLAVLPGDAAGQVAIGDAWWDAAQSAKATQKPELQAGAGYWYSLAAPALSGLPKARIDKRLVDTTAALPAKKIPATKLPAVLAVSSSTPPDALNQGVVPTRGFGDARPAGGAVKVNPTGAIVDVLAQIDPKVHRRNGTWSREGAAIVTAGGASISLELPITRMPVYRLEAVVEQHDELSWLLFGLPVGNHDVAVFLDRRTTPVSGLMHIDGRGPASNSTKYDQPVFTPNQPTRIVIDVSPAQVQVECDGKKVIDWSGDTTTLSISELERTKHRVQPQTFWIGAFGKGFRLTKLTFQPGIVTGAVAPPAIPATSITPNATLADPVFQQWMKSVAALPVQQQADAVSKKLMELNPGFDGQVRQITANDQIIDVGFTSTNVTNLAPVRALTGLKQLNCNGNGSKLFDLTPLSGMPLTLLYCTGTSVSDLSPLRGMPLTSVSINNTKVSDLSVFRGMPLTVLNCGNTAVVHLTPLHDCRQLRTLDANGSKVTKETLEAFRQAMPNCTVK